MQPSELVQRNIIPDEEYFDDHETSVGMKRVRKNLAKEDLKWKLKNKPEPEQIVQKGLANEHFWEQDNEDIQRNKQRQRIETEQYLQDNLKSSNNNNNNDRDITDLDAKDMLPDDAEVLDELKSLAKRHKHMDSAVIDLQSQLPFDLDTSKTIAKTMLKHLTENDNDINLIEIDNTENEQLYQQNPQMYRKVHRRQASQALENQLANRKGYYELQQQKILEHTNMANAIRAPAKDLEEHLKSKPNKNDLYEGGLLKRQKVATSLQPNAEALESELVKVLNKLKQEEQMMNNNNDHPLFRLNNNSNKHKRKGSSGFGSLRNKNPQYYKHDIAPSIQAAANAVHKRTLSRKIGNALSARPTREDLIDQRILFSDNMASNIQGKAFELQEKLKQRVHENYLLRQKVLLHHTDKIAPKVQANAVDLEEQLRRRPSLFNGDNNEDLARILGAALEEYNPHGINEANEDFLLVLH